MKVNFKKIADYIAFDAVDKYIFIFIKSILLLFAGVLLKEVLLGDTKATLIFSLVSTFLGWFFIEYRILKKEKSFPVAILDHLTAVYELNQITEEYRRKENLTHYIRNSICQLNSNVCLIQSRDGQTSSILSEEYIKKSLNGLLSDLIASPQDFLKTNKTNFTIGIYLHNILDPNSPKGQYLKKPISLVLRDDFLLTNVIQQDHPTTFYLLKKINQSLQTGKFDSEHQLIDDGKYLFVFSAIPNVCGTSPSDGTIAIICKQNEVAPADLENTMLVFGQIVSNWISKFNDHIHKKKK